MLKNTIRRIFQFIDRFHWLWLALSAPFLVFPSPKRSLALIVIPLLWIQYIISGRYNQTDQLLTLNLQPSTDTRPSFPVTPLNTSLLVLSIMLLVSLWATYSMKQSLEKISGLALGLGVFFAIVRESRRPNGWWWSLLIFLGGGLGWALMGFLGMNYQVRFSFLAPLISRIPIIMDGLPGADTGLQHNAVGGTLVWIMPSLIGLSVYLAKYKIEDIKLNIGNSGWGKRWFESRWGRVVVWVLRIGVWVGTLFMGIVLLLTQSRGSYLAMGLTALLVIFLILPKRWRWILLAIIIIAIVAITIYIDQSGGWEAWIYQLGLSSQSVLTIDTLGKRLEIWSRAIYGIQDFPITGMGMNTYREVVHVLYPLFTISPEVDIAHAHNEFLQAALDLGIPGLIAFLSIYIISIWMLVKIWKNPSVEAVLPGFPGEYSSYLPFQNPILTRVLVLGLGGGLFGHMIFGMTDAITLGAKPGIFFWILLGLITGLYQNKVESWKV